MEGQPLRLDAQASVWVRRSQALTQVRLSYTPFASETVTAEFDWSGFEAAWRQLEDACRVPED